MIKARIWKGYLLRMGLMAAMVVFFCGWFFYDGFVGYPYQAAVYQAFEELRGQEGGREPAAGVWNEKIDDPDSDIYGYPPSTGFENPGSDRSANDIFVQRLIAFILLPVALLASGWFLVHLGRWVACDERGVHTSSGIHVPFDSIKQLDKERWVRKGIAILTYHDANRKIDQHLTLDDWKYERIPTRAILETIESHLTDEQIVGGEREDAGMDEAEHADTENAAGDTGQSAESSETDAEPR